MAELASSSLLQRLATSLRLLSLRSDIDNIVLELLGQFSLEKIYAEGDQEEYQSLVVALLIQLNSIFTIQRLSLPSENLQVGWYAEFLASYEVTLRSVEYVLQVIVEGRESLWEARLLRDKYLAEFLLSALRFVTLHPRIPSSQRGKDQRDRFARIHKLLERIFDSYPPPESALLLVCRETTDVLRTRPNGLTLPPRLKTELPNVATKLYPLPECLQAPYVSTIVPQNGSPGDWLSQFFILRDISQFIIGASVQYADQHQTLDVNLQEMSGRTRDAVLQGIEAINMHPYFDKKDLNKSFAQAFRTVVPDPPTHIRQKSAVSYIEDNEMDALDALHARLNDRQIVNRASDHAMISGVSKVTRNIELLDDPTSQARAGPPKLYAVNCTRCHIVGDGQLRRSDNRRFSSDDREETEIILPLKSKCLICGEGITMMREILAVRLAWDTLKPLESDFDTKSVERHLSSQFQLSAPKVEGGMPPHPNYNTSPPNHMVSPISPDRSRGISNTLISPSSPGMPEILETPLTEVSRNDLLLTTLSNGGPSQHSHSDQSEPPDPTEVASVVASEITVPTTIDSKTMQERSKFDSVVSLPYSGRASIANHAVPSIIAPSERRSSKWKLKLSSSRKPSTKSSGDSSSISSNTLESQRLEEISLKSLINTTQASVRGKAAKNVNVAISQNSTYVIFWTQASINIWDVKTSSPILGREVPMDSSCLLVAATKVHLAYMIGTRDRLTLRIVNLIENSVPVLEYKVPSSLWCHSIAICPSEKYVAVGFDNATVRFFETSRLEEPKEDRLHARIHPTCGNRCPPVDTLSFSNDGSTLIASTRIAKTGLVQVYLWRFPFNASIELSACRYPVPVLESEDNGVTSAHFRSGIGNEDDLVCITTWTQSGSPVLIQPQNGHRTQIKTHTTPHGKADTRVQCSAFSPSGRELALVNERGYLYYVSSLNSSPLEIKRVATSKELQARSYGFGMTFMALPEGDAIVMAWAEPSKNTGFVKKVPIRYNTVEPPAHMPPVPLTPRYELAAEGPEVQKPRLHNPEHVCDGATVKTEHHG